MDLRRGHVYYIERVGDCIYDFSFMPPKILPSVHNEGNRDRDMRGQHCLLSTHFYYFGDNPEPLPNHLLKIVRQGQGHKSKSNDLFYEDFVEWITKQEKARNKIFSEPYSRHLVMADQDCISECAKLHREFDDLDEEMGCD